MTWIAICLAYFALGLAALALVMKFADWYDDRHERRHERQRRAYIKVSRRYADGLEDELDLAENVKQRATELEEERKR